MSKQLEVAEAFKYIGGQGEAVKHLTAVVKQEETGTFLGRKPLVLIVGESGMGKTALATATARALNAGLLFRTTEQFLDSEGMNCLQFIRNGYDEARLIAASHESNRAVYVPEELDVMMGFGEQPAMSVSLGSAMARWSEDFPGNVLVVATAYGIRDLRAPVLGRFERIELKPLDKARVIDIFTKGIQRLSMSVGGGNMPSNPEGLDILVERILAAGMTTRGINNLIRRTCMFTGQRSIDVDSAMALVPPGPRTIGFRGLRG